MSYSVFSVGSAAEARRKTPSTAARTNSGPASRKHPYSFFCSECGQGFTRPAALKEHNLSHTGEQPYSCGVCGTRFRRRNDHTRHVATAHKEKEHVCGGTLSNGQHWGCGVRFSRVDALKEHWRRPVGTVCRKLYFEDQQKISSEFSQTGTAHTEDEFKCHLCERVCKGEAKLNAHLEAHLQDFSDLPFRCDCGMAFATSEMKKSHAYRFFEPTCGVGLLWGCGKKFSTHDELAQHLHNSNGAECVNKLRAVEKGMEKRLKEFMENPSGLSNKPKQTSTSARAISSVPPDTLLLYSAVAESVSARGKRTAHMEEFLPQLHSYVMRYGDQELLSVIKSWQKGDDFVGLWGLTGATDADIGYAADMA